MASRLMDMNEYHSFFERAFPCNTGTGYKTFTASGTMCIVFVSTVTKGLHGGAGESSIAHHQDQTMQTQILRVSNNES